MTRVRYELYSITTISILLGSPFNQEARPPSLLPASAALVDSSSQVRTSKALSINSRPKLGCKAQSRTKRPVNIYDESSSDDDEGEAIAISGVKRENEPVAVPPEDYRTNGTHRRPHYGKTVSKVRVGGEGEDAWLGGR